MSNLDVSKSSFYDCIERENEELKQDLFNKTLEFEGINSVLRNYDKCLKELHKIIVKSYCVSNDEEEMQNRLNEMQKIIEENIGE